MRDRSSCSSARKRRSSRSTTGTRSRPCTNFAEGWNRLAYALFLANSYDASLAALDKVLALKPMHYAALAGKGIILIQ